MSSSPVHYVDGAVKWYWDVDSTKLHRDDGPAVEHPDGRKAWYRRGLLHRTDGPASINMNHRISYLWAIDGVCVSFMTWVKNIDTTDTMRAYYMLKYGK